MSETTLAKWSEDFPSVITLPVQWGDQDALGHVNNIVYFRWFESSRVAYMNNMGLRAERGSEPMGPILASIHCDYRRQLTYPETVHVGARVVRIGRSSIDIEHQVRCDSHDQVVAEAKSTLVVFDYEKQSSVPVPEAMRQAIAEAEGRAF